MQSYPITAGPAVFVPMADKGSATVVNQGPDTVYYGNTPLVTTGTALGSIVSGASLVTPGQYFVVVAGAKARLVVYATPETSFDRVAAGYRRAVLSTGDGGTTPTAPHVWSNFLHVEISSASVSALPDAQMDVWPIWLPAGLSFTRMGVQLGSTAWAVAANSFLALYDDSRALIIQTPDDLTNLGAVSTPYDRPLTGSVTYTVDREGLYYLGMTIKATTKPTFGGRVGVVTTVLPWARIRTTSTGLTGTAPASFTALSEGAGTPYIYFK